MLALRIYMMKISLLNTSHFFITNDTILENKKTIEPLQKIFNEHSKLGIISPCSGMG